MTYTKPHWRDTSTGYERDLHLENRITSLEHTAEAHAEEHEDHHRKASRQDDRLNLHEKAILALATGIYMLLQDKFPEIARFIKEIAR